MTVVERMESVQVVTAKYRSAREASSHPTFMSNYLTISHTCYPCLPCRGVGIGPFEVVCGAGDAAVIGRVEMSNCDTSM